MELFEDLDAISRRHYIVQPCSLENRDLYRPNDCYDIGCLRVLYYRLDYLVWESCCRLSFFTCYNNVPWWRAASFAGHNWRIFGASIQRYQAAASLSRRFYTS